MKKEIILYKFEWCKNRTTMIFFVSMIFLFLFCLWIVADCCIEKYSYSAPSIFVSDFKTSYEKAKTIYEENPTFENLLTLNRSIAIYEMQKKVIESGRDLNKNCYYCQGLEHDFLLAIKETNLEEESLYMAELERALLGDFYDYLSYQELKQKDKLSLLNGTDSSDTVRQYKEIYRENLALIHYFQNQNDIIEWQMDLIAKNIENESLLIWNAEVYKSELEFSIDNELKKEYSTYDNYIKTNKNLIENLKNQRKMELYSLYNHMEPVENPISGAKNVELLVMSRVPIGMIFMFLLFVSFYGFPLFRERKLQLVNLVKTKNYNSKVIFVSKFLYYSSLLILLTLSFLFFFLIACTIYHVSLDSVFLTIKDGGVISFSFISYLIENVVRLFAIFHVLLLLFLAVSCIQKRVIVPYVFVLLLILFFYHPNASANPYYLTLSYNIVPNILNVQYLGDTFFIYLLVILIICVILYFINILIWKKKW